MDNNNILITKKDKIKFAYHLYNENVKYDKACNILKISRRTYANWISSFKRIGFVNTIKYIGKWKNGGTPKNKISPSILMLVSELRKIDR